MAAVEQDRRRAVARVAAVLAGLAVLGSLLGLIVGVATPAHVEIAGSDTRIWLEPGRNYDEVSVDGILSATRATTRTLVGEPLGVRAALSLDASQLTDSSGQFDVAVLPAYIQAYSDPEQLVHDIRHALVVHMVLWAVLGAAALVALFAARRGYRVWRDSYDSRHWKHLPARHVARAYRAPERAVVRYGVLSAVVLVALGVVPSGDRATTHTRTVVGDAIFDGTPLAGVHVRGLLRPALVAAENYIETYFAQTNAYYDQLRAKLTDFLDTHTVSLPGAEPGTDAAAVVATASAVGAPPGSATPSQGAADGSARDDDIVQLGFVTDRHCNIGMDRVIVELLHHFGVTTLISGGDDAFSGSFGFEAACTRNLADKTGQAGISDIFVGGNHDSPTTLADEAKQGITVLDGQVVEHEGLQFIGSPDPRSSRYGQGLVPSSQVAQDVLQEAQGASAGATACRTVGPVIVVMHGPLAGRTAMNTGCGHVTLALDGHTHAQLGPTPVPLSDGTVGYQFVGASSGGAPGEHSLEQTFAARLTVGPLHNDATVDIVTVRRSTGRLIGVTEFRFTPQQQITVTQQRI